MSELYPGSMQTPAMLVSKCPTDWKKKLESGDYIGTEKKDGHWFQIEVTDDGTVYLFGRSKSKKTGELSEKITNVPHIKEWAEQNLPKGTTIIGEIYRVGETSKAVTSIMGCLPKKAVERQFDTNEYGGPIHYYIHDIIRWNNQDLTNISYYSRIEYIRNLDSNDYIEIAEPHSDNLEDYLQKVFDNGGEGMVFRHRDSIYKPGKRPKEIFKIKTEETLDCIIIGFVDPVKEYTGKEIDTWKYWLDGEPVTKAYYYKWRAGVIVGAYDNNNQLIEIGKITSGITDYMKETMSDDPYIYLNKVIEIQCMSVDSQEMSIRHGRFIRMREDKSQEECTVESIFNV